MMPGGGGVDKGGGTGNGGVWIWWGGLAQGLGMGGVKQRILSYHMTPVTQVIGHRQQHCSAALQHLALFAGHLTLPSPWPRLAVPRYGGGGGYCRKGQQIARQQSASLKYHPQPQITGKN